MLRAECEAALFTVNQWGTGGSADGKKDHGLGALPSLQTPRPITASLEGNRGSETALQSGTSPENSSPPSDFQSVQSLKSCPSPPTFGVGLIHLHTLRSRGRSYRSRLRRRVGNLTPLSHAHAPQGPEPKGCGRSGQSPPGATKGRGGLLLAPTRWDSEALSSRQSRSTSGES